jgi:hypothetical protein
MKSKRKRTLDKEIQMMAMGGDSGCQTAIKKRAPIQWPHPMMTKKE